MAPTPEEENIVNVVLKPPLPSQEKEVSNLVFFVNGKKVHPHIFFISSKVSCHWWVAPNFTSFSNSCKFCRYGENKVYIAVLAEFMHIVIIIISY